MPHGGCFEILDCLKYCRCGSGGGFEWTELLTLVPSSAVGPEGARMSWLGAGA